MLGEKVQKEERRVRTLRRSPYPSCRPAVSFLLFHGSELGQVLWATHKGLCCLPVVVFSFFVSGTVLLSKK